MRTGTVMLSLLRVSLLVALTSTAMMRSVVAQNVVENSDFSAGDEGWNVTQHGGEVATSVDAIDDPSVCPSEGSPGGCLMIYGTGYHLATVWQEITLIGGNQYDVDGQVRMLSDNQESFWIEFHVSTDPPVEGEDWTGNGWVEMPYGYASWHDCGWDLDGLFSENICGPLEPQLLARPFTATGQPGAEVTYYAGIKAGFESSSDYAFSIDDITVTAVGAGTSTDQASDLPSSIEIDAIYPNPFNPSATAALNIRDAGIYIVRVYDALGRVVREHTLAASPGRMEVPLQLSDHASGTYVVWIQHQTTGHVATAKALLAK